MLISSKEHHLVAEQPLVGAFLEPVTPFNAQLPPIKTLQSSGLPPPDLAPPAALHLSPSFYETVRNSQPLTSPTSSSTGATRGNSSSEVIQNRVDPSPRLTPMSASNDPNEGDAAQPAGSGDAPTSASFRLAPGASHPRSFQPAPPFYPGRSAPPQEQTYAPGPYGQPPGQGPGQGFMGQYMASQPSLPMPMQSPVQFAYSHSFPHPAIHAQDNFGHPQNRGYAYQHQPGPSAESHPGEHGGRSGSAYASPPPSMFADPPGQPQPPGSAPPSTASHVSHPGFQPLHFAPASSGPHYQGYSTHSFAHSTPGLYSYPAPSPYPQSYYGQQPSSPEDPSKGGTWWYLPPGNTQYDPGPYQSGYPMAQYQPSMQMSRPEFDPYSTQPSAGGPSSPSSAFPGPSSQQHRIPSASAPARERTFMPLSPVVPRAGPSGADPSSRTPATSPISKKRSPNDTASASPPPASRKSYHPNPPANRSEWVMWVGNVPSDATHDELWRFFNQPAPSYPPLPGASTVLSSRQVQALPYPEDQNDVWGGVASVFLISRSNCAFVNFETEHHLERAVQHFNAKPIRPKDPRCPRLVCRVRRRDDDLKAGVGGQRGMGLHTRWVAEQKERGRGREKGDGGSDGEGGEDEEANVEALPTSPSTYLAPSSSSDPSPPIPAVSPMDEPAVVPFSEGHRSSDEQEREPRHGSSGNQSFTSTNSSFLATNFPKRYFILKSLTQYDLNLSLERGLWATQPHNEEILDRAYRTSLEVFLIFGANKSGEFFGYARMAGPVFHSDRVEHVSWASRSSASAHHCSSPPEAIKEEEEPDAAFLSPGEHRMVGESPAPVTPGEEARLKLDRPKPGISPGSGANEELASAPAEMHQMHRRISRPQQLREVETLPEQTRKQMIGISEQRKAASEDPQFVLNPRAPFDATRAQARRDANVKANSLPKDDDGVFRKDTHVRQNELRQQRGREALAAAAAKIPTPSPAGQQEREQDPTAEDKPEGWGREFKIEWVHTERLPFHRTRHLRNPWNHDREVKVSRDGTEIEPTVGQQLLDEWDKLLPEPSPPTSPVSPTRGGRGGRPPVRAVDGVRSPGVGTPMPSFSSLGYRVGAGGSAPSGYARGRGSAPP